MLHQFYIIITTDLSLNSFTQALLYCVGILLKNIYYLFTQILAYSLSLVDVEWNHH